MREREEETVRWLTIGKEGERKIKVLAAHASEREKKIEKFKRRNDSQQPQKNCLDFANLTNSDHTCS